MDEEKQFGLKSHLQASCTQPFICDKRFHDAPSIFCAERSFFFSQQKPPSCQHRENSERRGACFLVSKLESLESKPESLDPKQESLDSSLNIQSFLVQRIEMNPLIDCQLTCTFGRYSGTCAKTLAKTNSISKLFLENQRELQECSKIVCSRHSLPYSSSLSILAI